MAILCADIGATHSRLAVMPGLRNRRTYPSTGVRSLQALLDRYRAETNAKFSKACIALPGPKVKGTIKTTNLPWPRISEAQLRQSLRVPVRLTNDFEAAARGVSAMRAKDLAVLQRGRAGAGRGPAVVLGPGSGLGGALLLPCKGKKGKHQTHIVSGEPGQVDFAPRNAVEWKLASWMREQLDRHPQVESVISGPGLVKIYTFVCHQRGSVMHRDILRAEDVPEAITQHASSNIQCRAAVELWCQLFGAAAGNEVLRARAVGGLYIAGGIAPHIIPVLRRHFISAFLDKPVQMQIWLRNVPIRVVRNPWLGLIGCAKVFK